MKRIKVVDNTNIVNLDTINSTSLNFILDKDQSTTEERLYKNDIINLVKEYQNKLYYLNKFINVNDIEYLLVRDLLLNPCHRLILNKGNKNVIYLDKPIMAYNELNVLQIRPTNSAINTSSVITNYKYNKHFAQLINNFSSPDTIYPKVKKTTLNIENIINLIKESEIYYLTYAGTLSNIRLNNISYPEPIINLYIPEKYENDYQTNIMSYNNYDVFDKINNLINDNNNQLFILKSKLSKERYNEISQYKNNFRKYLNNNEIELLDTIVKINKEKLIKSDCAHNKYFYDLSKNILLYKDIDKYAKHNGNNINCKLCDDYLMCKHKLLIYDANYNNQPHDSLIKVLDKFKTIFNNNSFCKYCGETIIDNRIIEKKMIDVVVDTDQWSDIIHTINIFKLPKIVSIMALANYIASIIDKILILIQDTNKKQTHLLRELHVIIIIYSTIAFYCVKNSINVLDIIQGKKFNFNKVINLLIVNNGVLINSISYMTAEYIKSKFNEIYMYINNYGVPKIIRTNEDELYDILDNDPVFNYVKDINHLHTKDIIKLYKSVKKLDSIYDIIKTSTNNKAFNTFYKYLVESTYDIEYINKVNTIFKNKLYIKIKNEYYYEEEPKYSHKFNVNYSDLYNINGESKEDVILTYEEKESNYKKEMLVKSAILKTTELYNLYLYYKDYCDIKGEHKFTNNKCEYCKITLDIINNLKIKKIDDAETNDFYKNFKNKEEIKILDKPNINFDTIKLWNISYNNIVDILDKYKLQLAQINSIGNNEFKEPEIKDIYDFVIYNIRCEILILATKLNNIDISMTYYNNNNYYFTKNDHTKLYLFNITFLCYLITKLKLLPEEVINIINKHKIIKKIGLEVEDTYEEVIEET